MFIREIFAKDISRPINGVVKAEQRNDEVVWQELDEFVATKEIQKHLHQFIKAYLQCIDNPKTPAITDNMGVWVSGFFGSGKSHFIKILSYLLGNIEARNPETNEKKRALSFFEQKIKDNVFFADLKRAGSYDTDVILFNIDSKNNYADGKAAILMVFWRLFNGVQGFCKDSLQVAEIERQLASKGKLDSFCTVFEEIMGSPWEQERDAYMLHQDEISQALSKVLGKKKEAAEAWFNGIIEDMPITVEAFASRVKEYLDTKGKNQRIIFLADEMGQFIGEDTSLMLNLQTITEDLGRLCSGRAWVVVTSQEAIDFILQNLKGSKANDFSKIQGRFKTRLSLSGSNTDEVIQVRLLEKTSQASDELRDLYSTKEAILNNQLSFTSDCATLPGYTSAESFIKNYPFVPYHFQIIQKVFETIRKTGFTGKHLSQGERSMLDAFQSSAISLKDEGIGALSPMYAFYSCIESFLDTSVKRSIEQASENTTLKPFDIQLLQALFLIRHVNIIKPNIENLATLCIDQVDADRISLKKRIGESLDRLEHEHLISSSGGLYYFLTNEEREVSQEIKSVEVTSSEENSLIREIIFEEILKDKSKYRYNPFKNDYPYNRICDSVPHKGKTDQELTIEIITPMNDEIPSDQSHFIMHSAGHKYHLIIKLSDDPTLAKEVTNYKQTEKYILKKHDASVSPSMKDIMKDLAENNRQRKGRITSILSDLIIHAIFYSMGSQIEIKATSPQTAIEDGLDYLIPNVYSKFPYLKLHGDPVSEIKEVLKSDDLAVNQLMIVMQEHEVGKDVKEVMEHVNLLQKKDKPIILSDIVSHFSSIPYGWPEWEIVLIIARLYMGSKIYLVSDGGKLVPDQALKPLTQSSQWKNLKVMERAHIKPADIKKARDLGKDLFGTIAPEAQEQIYQFLKKDLEQWQDTLIKPQSLADTGQYPGKVEIDTILKLVKKLTSIHDSYEFIQAFIASRDDLLSVHDDLRDIKDFYANQKPTWELLKKAADEFKPNREILEKDTATAKSLEMIDQILQAPRPYGMLSSASDLIASVREKNNELITKEREHALIEIDAIITKLKSMLDEKKADGDFRNKILHPIQSIKTKVETEGSIANIKYHLNENAQTLFDEGISLIESYGKPVEDGKTPRPVKTVKEIKASAFVTKQYIETEADIDEYVDTLKKMLQEALKSGNRVRIK